MISTTILLFVMKNVFYSQNSVFILLPIPIGYQIIGSLAIIDNKMETNNKVKLDYEV